jgi:uncharacterized tellurite resistance protein B-like protein
LAVAETNARHASPLVGSPAWDSLKCLSSSPSREPNKAFALELVRLLLQVAWADHDVAPAETEALLAFGRRSGLSQNELEELADMLAGRAPLVPPNLSVLKTRRAEVLRAVNELILKDVKVADEENELLTQIAALLG